MTAKKREGKSKPQKKKRRKTPAKTPVASNPILVAQPHGGALLIGNPGNSGGTGRPPSIVRTRARDGFYARIPVLEEIADKASAHDSDRIAAVATLGRFGLGGSVTVDDVRERLRLTLREIRTVLTPELASDLIPRIARHWGVPDEKAATE